MDNYKSELLETLETVSKFAGTLAGKVVVRSKEISDCVKNMMTAKLEPKPEASTKATESIKNQAKKKIDMTESSRSPQSCSRPKAGLGENAVVEAQKPKRPVTKTKKSSVKSSRSTAKN
ncbi:hypothetical protein ES703_17553 [subsurface metagenome]